MLLRILAIVTLWSAAPSVFADQAGDEFFEKSVRPVLVQRCVACHGPKVQKSGLRLDSREAALKGGIDGPVIVPGKPADSRIIDAVKYTGELKMPEKKLPDAEIAALEKWVTLGAPWPASAKPTTPEQAEDHWSFRPVVRPKVPGTGNPLDVFIAVKLNEKKLKLSPEADRRTLIRRLSFDLIGLPPTPEEVAAFEADKSPDAYGKLVDRLLASPRYGERWARHWLDVARYADNKGYVFFEEKDYPWAWTYRDYVIGAFNNDLSFDRFVMEQIAADRLELDDKKSLAAMGFLTVGGALHGERARHHRRPHRHDHPRVPRADGLVRPLPRS